METCCALFGVLTEFLNIICMSFGLQRVKYMFVIYKVALNLEFYDFCNTSPELVQILCYLACLPLRMHTTVALIIYNHHRRYGHSPHCQMPPN
jgi:hypothetical protein